MKMNYKEEEHTVSFSRIKYTFINYFEYSSFSYIIFEKIISPFLEYIMYTIILYSVGTSSYLGSILLGTIGFVAVRNIVLNLTNMIRQEKSQSILELKEASPKELIILCIEKGIAAFIDSLILLVISFVIVILFFNLNFSLFQAIIIFGIYILILIEAVAFGIIFSGMSLLLKNTNLFFNIVMSSIQLVSGFIVPISLFPNYLKKISLTLPFTNGIQAIRLFYSSNQLVASYPLIMHEAVNMVVLFFVAIFLFRTLENYGRKNGNIISYSD